MSDVNEPGAPAGNSPAASAGERDDSTRRGESAAEKATSNTDPLSIIALAASIAALILTLFSLMPMLAFCFFPIGVVCAATALLCSVASLVRTTVNRKLEGRQQALFSLGLLGIYGVAVWVLLSILARH